MHHQIFIISGGKMLTKLDLCSMALLKFGEKSIQSLNEDCPSAQLARTLFDPVIDALLSLHPWRFATQEITLTANTDSEFLIPTNVLRILKTTGRIVGNKIVAPGKTLKVIAIVRTGPKNMPGYFVSLAATKLAMEFCIPLSGDQTVFRMLAALYETELQSAKFIDSTTAPSPNIETFSLINARF